MRLEYAVAHHLPTLHDELIRAGISPTYLGDDPDDPDGIEMEVPDGTDPAAVAAVVAAHNGAAARAAWQAARQAEADDNAQVRAAVATLATDADNLIALATALENTANTLTTQALRDRMASIARGLARTDRILASALRVIARRTG